MSKIFKTFSFRLTLWYAFVSFGTSVLGFLAVYVMLDANMQERTDALAGADIQIADLVRADRDTLEDFREISAAVVSVVLLVSTVGGWFLARRSMAGVERVTESARSLGHGDLKQRVAVDRQGLEIENLAAAFNTMADRIEMLVAELREVINNVAHDLRSPLTRIRGAAEGALLDAGMPERGLDMAGGIVEECDRLIGIINTMLDIAETESGLTRISKDPVNLAEVVRDAYELFQPVAVEKGIDFRVSVSDEDRIVLGDRARLQRMVSNILDNALKYTPSRATVHISLGGDGQCVRISVTDTGVGIEAAELEHIFDRFYRCDQSRSTPGNGLGLSLARAVARAHGGEIHVESQSGRGSTFTVALPRGQSHG